MGSYNEPNTNQQSPTAYRAFSMEHQHAAFTDLNTNTGSAGSALLLGTKSRSFPQ